MGQDGLILRPLLLFVSRSLGMRLGPGGPTDQMHVEVHVQHFSSPQSCCVYSIHLRYSEYVRRLSEQNLAANISLVESDTVFSRWT